MIRDFLKALLLVNGPLAVTFGIFYQLAKLCVQLDISPWLALVVTMLACVLVFWGMQREAVRRWG